MQFAYDGTFHKVARITGPTHNMLSLRLIDGLGSSAPSVVNIGNQGSLNGGAVASAVLAGVAEANRRFDAHYSVAVLRYCEDDTPPESIYQLLAFSIVERLVADPSFGASHLEKTHMDHDQPLPAKRVPIPSPECDAMTAAIKRAMRMTAELNKLSFDDVAKVRELFGELTGRKVDDTVILIPPFYSAYGLTEQPQERLHPATSAIIPAMIKITPTTARNLL